MRIFKKKPDAAVVPSGEMLFERRDLIRLIIPLIIEQALNMTVGMFDTIMVSSAGETAVSGVSLVEAINGLMLNLFLALATGGAIVAGQYLGKRDRENASHAGKQLVVSVMCFATVVSVICLCFNGQLLRLLFGDTEAAVMSNARAYFYITAPSYPFIALFNCSAALFRIMGNSKISMVNALIMNGMNIIGNAVFIYCLGWGAFGAGLATLIARMAAAATMLAMLRNEALPISVRSYKPWEADLSMIKRIMRIGLPNGLENSMFQIGRLIMTSLVASFGTMAIAANAVAISVAMVQYIPGQAVGFALTTVMARCVGAGEYEQARYYLKRLILLAHAGLAVFNILMWLGMNRILGVYNLSEETFLMARQLVFLHAIAVTVIWPLSFDTAHAFRATGDVRFTMILSIVSMWLVRVGGSYLMAHVFHLGLLSVWLGMFADWIFRSIFLCWRWASGRWQKAAVV